MTETTRKCGECKNLITLEKDGFVIEKDIYYHDECLVKFLSNPRRRKKLTIEEAKKHVEGLKEWSKDHVTELIEKDKLFKWIQRKYDIVTMPSGIFTRLESVFSGTYRGMSRSIPPADILDMWQRKWNDMVKTYSYNVSIGKKMDNIGRVYYDLAIVLAKSDSYYKWKEKTKTKEQETIEQMQRIEINYKSVNNATMNNIQNKNDLSVYLEEI